MARDLPSARRGGGDPSAPPPLLRFGVTGEHWPRRSRKAKAGIAKWIFVLLTLRLAAAPPEIATSDARLYRGMCDASAAISLDNETFAVANDEDNKIRIYTRSGSERAVEVLDLSPFFGSSKLEETDLEGAAQLGGLIYWIGSHARNKEGKDRPNRRVFFATALRKGKGKSYSTLMPVGKPYRGLLADLIADPQLARYSLARAATSKPKAAGAFNIEGLCAYGTNQLLIGFRNPIPFGRALLVPLKNPAAVVEGRKAVLGQPVELELNGLGVRDLASSQGICFILAGSFDGKSSTRLYSWAGPGSKPQLAELSLKGYNPESLIIYPDTEEGIQILSDDGSRRKRGTPCKEIADPDQHIFRSFWIRMRLAVPGEDSRSK